MNSSGKYIYTEKGGNGSYFTAGAIVIALLITVANGLVLKIYHAFYSMRTFSNFLLVNLALSDAVTGVFIIPLTLAQSYVQLSRTVRFFIHAFSSAGIYTVVLNTTMVVLERYFALCHPYLSAQIHATRRKRVICLLPWVVVNIVAIIPYIWHHQSESDITYSVGGYDFAYSVLTLIVFFVIPLLVIAWSICSMVCCIRQIRRRSHTKEKLLKMQDMKAVIIFSLMILTFVISWLPFAIIRILEDAGVYIALSDLGAELLFFLRCLSSLINPLIYTIIKQEFRKGLGRLLITNMPFCNRLPMKKRRKKKNGMESRKHKSQSTPEDISLNMIQAGDNEPSN